VVPLIVSSGAGAEMRRTLGTAVFSGMLGVTLFGIFLTPVFFYVIAGFIDVPLFSSARARRIGQLLWFVLGVLTLGVFWIPTLLGRMVEPVRERRHKQRVSEAAANGHVSKAGETHSGSTTMLEPLPANGHATSGNGEVAATSGEETRANL